MSRAVKRPASLVSKPVPSRRGASRRDSALPIFVPPQLSHPVEKPPSGSPWLHEIKLDGYRMAARIDHGRVRLQPGPASIGPTNIRSLSQRSRT